MSRDAVMCCSHMLMLWYGGSLCVKRSRIVLQSCVDVMVGRVVVCYEEPFCVVVMY